VHFFWVLACAAFRKPVFNVAGTGKTDLALAFCSRHSEVDVFSPSPEGKETDRYGEDAIHPHAIRRIVQQGKKRGRHPATPENQLA
jgi:hypothetical protein